MTAQLTKHDQAFLDAEHTVFAHYGIHPTTHFVALKEPCAKLRVLEFGVQDGPPLLLLHGIGSVTALAAPLISELAAKHRILAVDWLGHGLSGAFNYSSKTWLRAHATSVIGGVLDHFALRKVDLAGHSLGGQFSLYFALDCPERVNRLVLLGAPGGALPGVRLVPTLRAFTVPVLGQAVLRLPMPQAAYRRASKALLGGDVLDQHPETLTIVGRLAARRPEFAATLANLFQVLANPFGLRGGISVTVEELKTLRAKTLLFWGEGDVFLSPKAAQASIEAIPNATLHSVSGGHAPWLDHPVLAAKTVMEFLEPSKRAAA
ncbi:MAG: alpha/beta fold hydrolase [Myxococcaceae bacterium]